jgi:hypothetical protein
VRIGPKLIDLNLPRSIRRVTDRSAQDRPKAMPDEVLQPPVASLRGRAASRATNAYPVRVAEIVLTH